MLAIADRQKVDRASAEGQELAETAQQLEAMKAKLAAAVRQEDRNKMITEMPGAFWILVILGSTLVVGYLISFSLRCDLSRLERLDIWSARFFRNVHVLMKYTDAPLASINSVEFWNDCVADKQSTRKLSTALIRANGPLDRTDVRLDPELGSFLDNHPEAREAQTARQSA